MTGTQPNASLASAVHIPRFIRRLFAWAFPVNVAALYVDPRGPYPLIPGLDCWDEKRDARAYAGPHPVIVHPPCGRWCGMARMNERRWGAKVGDDGGCFAAALASVRKWGGVLEHPARSIAWATFGLRKPAVLGWNQVSAREWTAEVWQSAYGHKATKRTWLYYVGDQAPLPFDLSRPRGSHQIGGGIHTGNRSLPRLKDTETHLTPPAFADYLVRLARNALEARS
jgi:hypothetical protein